MHLLLDGFIIVCSLKDNRNSLLRLSYIINNYNRSPGSLNIHQHRNRHSPTKWNAGYAYCCVTNTMRPRTECNTVAGCLPTEAHCGWSRRRRSRQCSFLSLVCFCSDRRRPTSFSSCPRRLPPFSCFLFYCTYVQHRVFLVLPTAPPLVLTSLLRWLRSRPSVLCTRLCS